MEPSSSIFALKASCSASAWFTVVAYNASPPTSAAIAPAINTAGFALIIAFNADTARPVSEDTDCSFIRTLTTVPTGPCTIWNVLNAATREMTTGATVSIWSASFVNSFPIISSSFLVTPERLPRPELNVFFKESSAFFAGCCISFGRSLISPSHSESMISLDAYFSCFLFFWIPCTNDFSSNTDASTILGDSCAIFTDRPPMILPVFSTAASMPPFSRALEICSTESVAPSAASFMGSSISS